MYIKKVLNMKKNLFIQIFLLLIMVIFGLNVGVTRVFAAESEVYAIYKSNGWYSYDISGVIGNRITSTSSPNYANITHAFIKEDVQKVQNISSAKFTNLKKIEFMGKNVKAIFNEAFRDSQALTSVIIPESVENMGECVFLNCSNLTNVAFLNRNNITTSGETTFDGTNPNLRVYVYPANENMAFIQGDKVPHKTVISPPADLKADLAENGITLNWTANTDATGYKVSRADSQNGTYTDLIGNTTSTTYTDNTAEKGKKYWYKVSSVYDTSKISNWQKGPVLESDPSMVTSFIIAKVSSERNSTNTATVKFTSNYQGQYYYAVVSDGDAQPSINTSITGTSCISGENTINLSNLTAGAKDIYIVSKDDAGTLSNVLKVDIDYDVTKVHKVTYDGNGNTAGSIPAEASYLPSDNVTAAKQGDLLKSGYSFLGWNTKQDGTGTAYKPDENIAIGTDDVTLYAQWSIQITYSGAQKKLNSDGTYDILFLATIDTLDADNVGFIFSRSKQVPIKGQVKDTNIKSTTKVYNSVDAMGTNITAASQGGKYIIACTVKEISENDSDKPLYARAFLTKAGETKYTEVYTVTAKGIK